MSGPQIGLHKDELLTLKVRQVLNFSYNVNMYEIFHTQKKPVGAALQLLESLFIVDITQSWVSFHQNEIPSERKPFSI